MRPTHSLLLLLVAMACNEGTIPSDVDADGGVTDDDADGSGASQGSGDASGSDGSDGSDPDEPGSDWAGDIEGEQTMDSVSPQGEWRELCFGDAAWTVSSDGTLTGQGECELQRGPAAGEVFDLDYSGRVDEAGEVFGEVTLTRSWMDGRDVIEMEGSIEGDGADRTFEAKLYGTIETRNGETEVEGSAFGER